MEDGSSRLTMLSTLDASSLLLPLRDESDDNIKSFQEISVALDSQLDNLKVTPKDVAKIVCGLRRFQQKHLSSGGGDTTVQEWPMLKLPDELFRDRSQSGPLCTALLEVYEDAVVFNWEEESSESLSKLRVLQRMETALLDSCLLQRPAVYWDTTVDKDLRQELQDIVERFGGATVTDSRHATHVVAFDGEIDGTESNNATAPEKLYLRTLLTSNNMAFVHWWYWPSSHDDWMPAEDVDGDTSEDNPPRPPGGPWVVSCKFVRDVARFNEWGVEADYAIADYHRKVNLYKNSQAAPPDQIRKKARINRRTSSREATTKQKKVQEKPKSATPKRQPTPSATPPASTRKDRRAGQGMNPRYLSTGLYGARGERIRHLVHDGALRISPDSLEIIQQMENSSQSISMVDGVDCTKVPATYDLPPIDSIIRPCTDRSLGSIMVTELSIVTEPPPADAAPDAVPTTKTLAMNRRIDFRDPPPQRIRGGGDEEHGEHVPDTAGQLAAAPVASSAPTGAPTDSTTPQHPQVTSEPSGDLSQSVSSRPALASSSTSDAPGATPVVAKAPAQSAAPSVTSDSTVAVVASSAADSTPASASTTSSQSKPQITVSSTSSQAKPQATVSASDLVTGLDSRPSSNWKQHIPDSQEESMMTTEPPQLKPPKPSWYDEDAVSDFERMMLPEWFDQSAPHRSPDSYKTIREQIMNMSDKLRTRYVTCTLIRRSLPGDMGSLMRLHGFLVAWGLINDDAINDSAPTGAGLRRDDGASWRQQPPGTVEGAKEASATLWTSSRRDSLLEAVVEESNKRQKVGEGTSATTFVPIDWDAVANRVGNGVSSDECEEQFLSLPLDDGPVHVERSITPDQTSTAVDNAKLPSRPEMKEEVLCELVEGARPEVVKAATDAALSATNSLPEAQKASVLGVLASRTAELATREEESVGRLLGEILAERVTKIESRMALMDDVEGMLEAERVALELERRDLYTARCRHWFGGGT